MTTLTETPRNAGFILSEAAGQRSRENADVLLGQDLDAGEVVRLNSDGRLTAWTNENFTDGSEDRVIGVLVNAADATDAHVIKQAYIARDAEVNLAELVYPAAQEAEMILQLKDLGIICR
jgi:hypothetical protein